MVFVIQMLLSLVTEEIRDQVQHPEQVALLIVFALFVALAWPLVSAFDSQCSLYHQLEQSVDLTWFYLRHRILFLQYDFDLEF